MTRISGSTHLGLFAAGERLLRLSAAWVFCLLVGCGSPAATWDAGTTTDAGLVDAAPVDAALVDAGIRQPDPSCVVNEVTGESIMVDPAEPRAGEPFWVRVTGPVGRTDVQLRLCTPDGLVTGTFGNVTGSYTWEFQVAAVAEGVTQIIFSADPGDMVYSTTRVTVGSSASSPDAGVPGLCDLPASSLVSAGDFESGMDGLAPTGWQVRNPDAPSACAGSGSPGEHVYLTASAPACGGQALVIDSRGQWDCYAVQYFTDYNTILGGHTYTLSAAVKSESQDNPAAWFVLGLQWLDGADQVFGDEKNLEPPDVNYDWTRLSFSLVAPANAHRAVVWLTGHYPGRVTFDKISLTQEN